MKESKEKTWISFRVKPDQYAQIHKRFKTSSSRKLSDYARKVLLEKPVVITYRDQSRDELLGLTMQVIKELNGIGNNFNQAVHKLHLLKSEAQFRDWYTTWSLSRQTLVNKIEEVRKILAAWRMDGGQDQGPAAVGAGTEL